MEGIGALYFMHIDCDEIDRYLSVVVNIESEIAAPLSQKELFRVVLWIGSNENRFAQLMHLFLAGEYRIVQRSSWIVSSCVERHPRLVTPWLPKLIRRAKEEGLHGAVRRNILRLLQFVDIPRRYQGEVTEMCFTFLASVDSPVAVKVFSMTVLATIAAEEPDLKNELRPLLEQMLPYGSAGMQSRAKKILQRLSR